MSLLWKGPSPEVTAALGNTLAIKLHRRAGRQNVAYNIARDGRSAEVFRMEKSRGQWLFVPLGLAVGADPLDVFMDAALRFTDHDAELFELLTALIEQRTAALPPAFEAAEKRALSVLSDLSSTLDSLRV
ncbi:MAG TPA: hypothetical protein VK181_16635 [Rhizobium sp.]|nr:hypothetical protein [Rhizobium sp.]